MSPRWWPGIIFISAVATGLMTFLEFESVIRAVVAFWFLLVCTGMAWIRLLKIEGWLTELTLAIGLSIAMSTIVSEFFVLAKAWSSRSSLLILIAATLVGVLLQLIQIHRLATDTTPPVGSKPEDISNAA